MPIIVTINRAISRGRGRLLHKIALPGATVTRIDTRLTRLTGRRPPFIQAPVRIDSSGVPRGWETSISSTLDGHRRGEQGITVEAQRTGEME